ncbi:DnaJ domain-containing protein, putative, partial [Eimeria maxima]
MSGSMDEVLQQTVVYGVLAVVLLSPRLPQLMPQRQAKFIAYMRKPVLTAVLMYLAYLPIATPRKNFYSMLEVDVHANRNDILQGYRNVSKKYHPDRVASSGVRPPFAGDLPPEEYFQELKKAQEVLTHDIRKSFYDRFGDLKEVGEQDERISITAIFFIYSVAVFCVEIQQRFVEDDDSLNFLPFVSGLLPYEKILFFRALFPFVFVGSICTSSWQYVDISSRHWAVLKALLSTNRVLTERTQELIKATSYLKTMGTPSVAALKAMGQQQQTLQSAAVRTKAAGIDVSAQNSGPLPAGAAAAAAAAANPNQTQLENFAASLSEEQKELFKRVIEEQ